MWRYRWRRLFRIPAIPGWVAVIWWLIEKASTVAWLRDVWVSVRPGLLAMVTYAEIAGVLGVVWLAYRFGRRWRVIDLLEVVRAQGNLVVENETITHRTIEGPATIFLDAGTTVTHCQFAGTSFAVVDESQRVIYGAIAFRNCTITNSTFREIGFVGTAAQIAHIRAGIKWVEPPQGQ
jgi:hypothetical protein